MSNAIEDPRVRAAIEHYLLDLENTAEEYEAKLSSQAGRMEGWCQANWPAIPDVWPASMPDHTNVAWSERRDRLRLRTQVDFLLGNHMLLRSGNRLPMELADCFPLDLPNEGFKAQGYTTKALVVVMNCGKTNQHGRMEYGSALRHRDPRSCLIGALAFWLFWRWQVEKAERFPVFQSEDWYETKVLRRSAKEPQAPLSGQTAREWTSRILQEGRHQGLQGQPRA
ncbi:centromere DNA-binding protein complex CBF3 subunit [Hirsutella rhossiliensis]|uniref:Centromere DNA-binding protein complex CBF3 subunit n=1 Tax=Hirsutella rhossiliensis TaxID=111463 RepID=A0A9P8N8J4_9HYPO|nr:centromere DNA-binding protein complex CBF3 subunit [Hirsutella rhossiliensis]KAH0968927.1 centromere DNA-binding protein complex CBF3 subunit [Hirsutella rhossiliensis]